MIRYNKILIFGILVVLTFLYARYNLNCYLYYNIVHEGNLPRAAALMRFGADANFLHGGILGACISQGRSSKVAMVELLLSHGADPNGRKDLNNPLCNAIGIRCQRLNDRYGKLTVDDRAEMERSLQIIKLLLRWKANPNIAVDTGTAWALYPSNYPFHWAIYSRDIAVVRMLLEAGANPNFGYSHFSQTVKALYFVRDGDTAMASLLKQYGAK